MNNYPLRIADNEPGTMQSALHKISSPIQSLHTDGHVKGSWWRPSCDHSNRKHVFCISPRPYLALLCLAAVLIQSRTDQFPEPSQALAPNTVSLAAPCQRKMWRACLVVFALTGSKWNLESHIHSTHPRSQGTGQAPVMPDSCSTMPSLCLRQLSSVWRNAQTSPPLASGRLSPRTKAGSKVLSLMQLWSAAAITSSRTSHWRHFQVRPGNPQLFVARV